MPPLTRVVNRHKEKYDVYVGRGTIWGNYVGLGSEKLEAIEKYRVWFLTRIKSDPQFREKTLELRGKVLGCSCAPRPCHAMVIAAYLDGEISPDDL